jgi:hypothetical protein
MEELVKVKASSDYYDDVHYRRLNNPATTLCGLKVVGTSVLGDVTCLRCRDFASGDF